MARPYRHGPSAVRVRGGMADNDLRARLVRGGASRAALEPSISAVGVTATLKPPAKPALSHTFPNPPRNAGLTAKMQWNSSTGRRGLVEPRGIER